MAKTFESRTSTWPQSALLVDFFIVVFCVLDLWQILSEVATQDNYLQKQIYNEVKA